MLEPPSPFRTANDIDNCVELFIDHEPSSVVSVQEANQYHPILMKKIEDGLLKPLCMDEPECVPRQLYDPIAYMRNGAVYVLRRENIINNIVYGNYIIPYIMPDEDPFVLIVYLSGMLLKLWLLLNQLNKNSYEVWDNWIWFYW